MQRVLFHSDPASKHSFLYVTIKDKDFRFIGVYGPNIHSKLPYFFRRIKPFVTSSRRTVLVRDWNIVLDPNLNREGPRWVTNNLAAKYFREFVARLDLVNKFQKKHPSKVEWIWTGRGASSLLSSYLNRVLVWRVYLDYLWGLSFEVYKNSDFKLLYVNIRLG